MYAPFIVERECHPRVKTGKFVCNNWTVQLHGMPNDLITVGKRVADSQFDDIGPNHAATFVKAMDIRNNQYFSFHMLIGLMVYAKCLRRYFDLSHLRTLSRPRSRI